MSQTRLAAAERPAPVRGAGCCIELAANPVSESDARERAKVLAALADPTRLRILGMLRAQGAPLCVCEINEAFPLGQPTISHHLRQLREAGLVRWTKKGLWVYYTLEPNAMRGAAAFLAALAGEEGGEGREETTGPLLP